MATNVIEITLTNNTPFHVRQLGLFELDNILPETIGQFTYTIEILGKPYEAEFKVESYGDNPPVKPEQSPSEIKPNTKEADMLTDWQLYEAAKLHNKRRVENTAKFYMTVKKYIIENACIDSPNLITTIEDWRRVYDAVLVPQLTIDLIAKHLH